MLRCRILLTIIRIALQAGSTRQIISQSLETRHQVLPRSSNCGVREIKALSVACAPTRTAVALLITIALPPLPLLARSPPPPSRDGGCSTRTKSLPNSAHLEVASFPFVFVLTSAMDSHMTPCVTHGLCNFINSTQHVHPISSSNNYDSSL